MKHIFELRMKDQMEERSSQLLRNLSSCEKKAWKKIPAWTGFEPMTSAMPVQAFFSQLLKLRSNCGDLSSIWLLELNDPGGYSL